MREALSAMRRPLGRPMPPDPGTASPCVRSADRPPSGGGQNAKEALMSATKTPSRPRLSEEDRAQKRAAERELMAEAIEQLRSSEGWKRWLDVRRHFHSYSFHNQLLIAHAATRRHPGRRLSPLALARLLRAQGRAGDPHLGTLSTIAQEACRVEAGRRRSAKQSRAPSSASPRSLTAPRSTLCPTSPAGRWSSTRRSSR